MEVPGAAWIALIAIVTPWVSTYFGHFWWGPIAVIILGSAAKLIEVAVKPPSVPATEVASRGLAGEGTRAEAPGKFGRFLFGG